MNHYLQTKKEDKKATQKAKTDLAEFGLSRGIDFQHVSNVINFDFPSNESQYVHRAGRTARAGTKGNFKGLFTKVIKELGQAIFNHQLDRNSVKLKRYRL